LRVVPVVPVLAWHFCLPAGVSAGTFTCVPSYIPGTLPCLPLYSLGVTACDVTTVVMLYQVLSSIFLFYCSMRARCLLLYPQVGTILEAEKGDGRDRCAICHFLFACCLCILTQYLFSPCSSLGY